MITGLADVDVVGLCLLRVQLRPSAGRRSYPGALSSDELVVIGLDAGPAAGVEVFRLEVGVVQLLRGLKFERERERARDMLVKLLNPVE